MAPSARYFPNLSGPQVGERLTERSIIVQPLGAIEQHGPHLPLSTDAVIATAVAEAAVADVGEELDVWLLPTLQYTKSNEHAWSPGTVWLSATTLLAVLDDIGRCVATTPATRLVFLNAHGGNSSLLSVAVRELRLNHGLTTFVTHPRTPVDQGGTTSPTDELGMGVHGGTNETSMMMHLAPELTDLSRARRRVPEQIAANTYVRFGGQVSFGWLSNDFHADGYIGDPTAATSERGAELFAGAVRSFCESLSEISTFDFGR
ncbi:MAG TPA: creatininase family protein [Ilumatobacteraceae bacterium]|nr:creatininase family protein [Ilumatobacteraceae bacterium]